MPLSIRPAVPDDAFDIATMHVRAWRAAYRGIVPDEVLDGLSVAARAASWSDQLTGDLSDQHTFVAEQEGVVVGFVALGPSRDPLVEPGTGEVYAIYVDPDLWGRGIGSSLLAQAVEELRSRGHASATLWVLAANQPGQRFYERRGWAADGSTKTYPAGEVELEEIRYRIEL
jgi:ribosomal protein S18 acetylase RimI-like enzyme